MHVQGDQKDGFFSFGFSEEVVLVVVDFSDQEFQVGDLLFEFHGNFVIWWIKLVGFEVLGQEFDDLGEFMQPIPSLAAETTVIDVVEMMRQEQRKIVLVTRRRGKQDVPVGIVTMKDLVEELMGELAEW